MEPVGGGDFPFYDFTKGEPFTIHGRNFSRTKEENSIRFLTLFAGELVERLTITPQLAGETELRALTPMDIEPGCYEIQVETPRGQSNLAHCWIGVRVLPPDITSIAPASQYPGGNVLISGNNFKAPAHVLGVKWESLDREGLSYNYLYEWHDGRDAARGGRPPSVGSIPFADGYLRWVHYGYGSYPTPTARVLSETQLELMVPQEILPGHYRIQIRVGMGWTKWAVLDVLVPSYRVVFDRMVCIDEATDHSPSNEIVTQWGISADGNVWSKHTGKYGDIDEGDEIAYGGSDRVVYLPDGGAGEVGECLLISTALYEWDRGRIETVTQVLGFVEDIATPVTNWLTGGGDIGGVEIGEIISLAFDAMGWLIGELCGEGADFVSEESRAWTAVELQLWTANSERRHGVCLPIGFDYGGRDLEGNLIYEVDDDDKGAFEVYFFIEREH
jgi:hypothetical protein